jgi:hypothetical protein
VALVQLAARNKVWTLQTVNRKKKNTGWDSIRADQRENNREAAGKQN